MLEKNVKTLVKLQEQLISDISKEKHKLRDVYDGIRMIKNILCNKKVLVILDDVVELKQIEGLACESDWFHYGSRIIITTRDESLLSTYEEKEYVIHKVDKLTYNEALQLFSRKAFKSGCPLEDFRDLSVKVVEYADGLPLALKLLGSHLRGKNRNQWESALDRLKEHPNTEIMEVLQISFDDLEETEKKIFLDIACFFNGSNKDYIMEIMDSCGFFPEIGISVLMDKSLLEMEHGHKLRMHDLLEEMGKKIVREKSNNERGRQSRIWLHDDFLHVMNEETGTEAVEAIVCRSIILQENFSLRGFSKMKKLRLLIFSSFNHFRNSDDMMKKFDWPKDEYYLSNELRFLDWYRFPFSSFLPIFQPHGLVELTLLGSEIEQLWNNPMKPLRNLINLQYSSKIRKFKDFRLFPNLEKLILDWCDHLEEIDPSITVLKRLTLLSLQSCERLHNLPSMDGLESLKVLKLFGCVNFYNLPEDLGCLSKLERLDVGLTSIRDIPSSIRDLKSLKALRMSYCYKLTSLGPDLPDSLEMVRVDDCSQLHTFLDPLSQCNLRCSAIFCVNCFNLVKRQGSKRTALTSLGRYLQNPPSPSKRFDIVLPGDEIPSWFTHQVRESSSISLPLHQNWCNNKWMGFALSVCFSTTRFEDRPSESLWQIKINQQDWGFGHVCCLARSRIIGKNLHVWLLYLARETYFHTEWQNIFGQIEFSFKRRKSIFVEETISQEFKQCGVRLEYEQDIEELNLTATHEPIELPINEIF